MVKAIEWVDGKVIMLDQTKLPFEVTYIVCTDYLMVADGIRKLRIRGAPAIGIAAAMGIALAAQDIHSINSAQFMKAIEFLAYAILPAGNTIEEHIDAVEEIYLIFKGGGVMKVGNETREVKEGDAIWIPAGEPHNLVNTGTEETFIIVVAAYP